MAPGDIIRHPDYPQWGRGYVIRAKQASADVFFRWGGIRRLDAGEPLEPSRPSGVEAELFARCASLSARSWSRGHHTVYAIELSAAVAVPEWNGTRIQVQLEEDAVFDGKSVSFLDGRQTALHLIGSP